MQRVEVILLEQVPRDVKKFSVVVPVLCGRGEQATWEMLEEYSRNV